MKGIVLIGYGGHASSVADSIRQQGVYEIIGYTDKEPPKEKTDYPYLGTDHMLKDVFGKGVVCAAIGVGYLGGLNVRDMLYKMAKDLGFQLPPIIDRTAILADNIRVGEGTYIGKGAIINAKSSIGKMCIINSGAIVEHESQVKEFSHVSVKAVLCGNVKVEDHAFIGANATVIQGIRIGGYSKIGAGSTILKNVPKKMTVYGIW